MARTSRCAIASSLDQKGARDLRGGQPADRAQRQRDLNLGGEGRMAAGEDQPQHVVVERGVSLASSRGCRVEQQLVRQLCLLAAKRDLPADAVDRLVAADIDQPGPRIGRRIGGRPALQRHRERILQRVLGEIEIADEADQRRQRPARLVAEYFFDFGWASCGLRCCRHSGACRRREPSDGNCTIRNLEIPGLRIAFASAPRNDGFAVNYKPMIGLTSIEPVLAPGIRAAMASAASRSLASTR